MPSSATSTGYAKKDAFNSAQGILDLLVISARNDNFTRHESVQTEKDL
jgi:hypothetical protein